MKHKSHVYKKRLLKLADFLDKLPKKRFLYEKWVGDDWKGKKDLSCGTTACALGWATTIPLFQKLGIHLGPWFNGQQLINAPLMKGKEKSSPEEVGWEIFGLSAWDYSFVFIPNRENLDYGFSSPDEDATPKQVATHIRKFVAVKYK